MTAAPAKAPSAGSRLWAILAVALATVWFVAGASGAETYRTVSQLHAEMEQLATLRPDLTEVFDYGDSYLKTTSGGGYDLKDINLRATREHPHEDEKSNADGAGADCPAPVSLKNGIKP